VQPAREQIKNMAHVSSLYKLYNNFSLVLSSSDDLIEGMHTYLLLLALQLFESFGLLNNSLPRFSIHSHLIPIMNLHFSQIRSDIFLSS
jgi:hypothetical protein